MQDDSVYIYGKNPVFEYIKKKPERINKIYIKDDASSTLFKELKFHISETNIQLSTVPLSKLNRMAGKDSLHQGVVAEISAVNYLLPTEWLDGLSDDSSELLVIVDSIQDPHNFGAIIRTAVAAGASAILIGSRDQVQINGTVIKTSSGLAEDIPIIRAQNLNQAIRLYQEAGFELAGTVMSGSVEFTDWVPAKRSAIIIGSEGRGMRRSVETMCDALLRIPMEASVESLNASVTAALMLYEWRRKVHQ
jgi:23S rRNA (guanosine2251-2'-O)-methyltransferase